MSKEQEKVKVSLSMTGLLILWPDGKRDRYNVSDVILGRSVYEKFGLPLHTLDGVVALRPRRKFAGKDEDV